MTETDQPEEGPQLKERQLIGALWSGYLEALRLKHGTSSLPLGNIIKAAEVKHMMALADIGREMAGTLAEEEKDA